MEINGLIDNFFNQYKEFLLNNNSELAKKVWEQNAKGKLVSLVPSSSKEAYNFGIFGLNLINPNLNELISDTEKAKVDFYSNIICDGNKDYSFDAIYIPDEGNIQIYDFKQGKQGLEFTDIEVFKNFFIDHIENSKRTSAENVILKTLLDKLDVRITCNKNIKCDIFIIREKEIDDSSKYYNQLNELRWKTRKADIGEINIIGGKEINKILKDNLAKMSDYNNESFTLKFNNLVSLEDQSNIIVTSLYDLLKFHLLSKKSKYDLFKLNVRKKIEKNEIRGDIIKTIEEYPSKFFRFHNGINLTCDDFTINNNKIIFKYPQIINGCQTVSALQDKFLKYLKVYLNIQEGKGYDESIDLGEVLLNIEKLKTAKILIKTHKTVLFDDEIERIAEYSNQQNPIDKENLRANDLIQIILENFIDKIGYKYIRKEGDIKEGKYIELSTLFQLIHTCIFELPNWSKNNKNQLFSLDGTRFSYLEILKNVNLDTIEIIIGIYFKYISFKESYSEKVSDYYDHHIILSIYYIVINGEIINKDFDKDFEKIYKLINDKILDGKGNPGLRRHLLQVSGARVWNELKLIIHNEYPLKITEKIGENEYNISELEKYKYERLLEKKKNPDSKLGNSTSVIKKLVSANEGIIKDDLILIMKDFYSFFRGNYVDKDRFIEKDILPILNNSFDVQNNKVYLKK